VARSYRLNAPGLAFLQKKIAICFDEPVTRWPWLMLALAACSEGQPPAPPSAVTSSVASIAASAASSSPASSLSASHAAAAPSLETAAAQARARGLPLLVDLWAAWCAPCTAFRSNVLVPSFRQELATQAVLFELDVDLESSASFTERYGVFSLPNLMVLDPQTLEVVAQRTGFIAREDVTALLASARATMQTSAASRARLEQAREARKQERWLAASKLFEAEAADATSSAKGEAMLAALDTALQASEPARCVALAGGYLNVPEATLRLALLQSMVACATSLAESDAARRPALEQAMSVCEPMLTQPSPTFSAHERAESYALAAWIESERGNPERTRVLQSERLKILEEAAAKAADALSASAYDPARVKALLALDREGQALELLTARARELPQQYEVQGRLGTQLLSQSRAEEARPVLALASSLAYGAPKWIYQARLADAYLKLGDLKAAALHYQRALQGFEGLPAGQRDLAREADTRERLASAKKLLAEGPPR
jgi:thioredoxin-like negative regulator of GroEL